MKRRWGYVRGHLLVLVCFAILVAVMYWPIVQNLSTHVPGSASADSFEVLWHIGRAAAALFESQESLVYEDSIYYPMGWHLASSAFPPWFAVALAPLTLLVGPVASLNLTQLGLLVIAGFGAYLMAYYLTQDHAVSIVAGLIFMTAPVLTLRLRGHVHVLAGAALLPYPFLAASLSLDSTSRLRRWTFGVLTGLALAICILPHWYFVFLATLPLGAFVLVLGATRRAWRAVFELLLAAGIVCLLLLGPLAIHTERARDAMHGATGNFALAESDGYSLSPDLLFAPNRFHPLWGYWATRAFPLTGEQDVSSLGYAATILAAFGVWRSSNSRKWTLLAVAGVSLVLAMGTTLHLRGARIELGGLQPLLSFVGLDRLLPEQMRDPMPIPLPGLLLARYLPFYKAIRVWGRFSIPLILMVSSLSALGLASLCRNRRGAWVLTLLFGLIVIAESWVVPFMDPYSGDVVFTDVAVNGRPSLMAWLAELPDETAIIEYPRPDNDVLVLYSQLLHGKYIVNGYMSIPPLHLQRNQAVLGHVPDSASLPLLKEWDVDYVVYSERAGAEADTAAIASIPGLMPVARFDEAFPGYARTHVFAISPDNP